EAITGGRKRALLTMATGTGKTLVAFQVCWKLWSAGWNAKGEHRKPREAPCPTRYPTEFAQGFIVAWCGVSTKKAHAAREKLTELAYLAAFALAFPEPPYTLPSRHLKTR